LMDNAGRVRKIVRRLGLRGNDDALEWYRVADVISDLRHFCDVKNIDFDQELQMAETYYTNELEEEGAQ